MPIFRVLSGVVKTQLVPFSCFRRWHLLLLRGHDFCGGGHPWTLQQNHTFILHTPNFEFFVFTTSAFSVGAHTATPPALLDESTGLLTMRMVEFKPASLSPAGHRCVKLLKFFRLVCIRPKAGATDGTVEMNNLTLINFILLQSGPTHERTLTIKVMGFQMVCSVVAFLIRYQAAKLFYHRVE